jgi:hypothetical protein
MKKVTRQEEGDEIGVKKWIVIARANCFKT